MSFAVVRGSPQKAQLYLDKVIDGIIEDGGTEAKRREEVHLVEIIFACMRANPTAVHSINASTNEKFTNERVLKRAVSIARALTAVCAKGTTVIIMLRNHEHMSALYYAVLLAGVIPFMMEPGSTGYELEHFISLVSPCLVFCEPDRRDDVTDVAHKSDVTVDVVVADGPSLDKLVQGCSDDVDSFRFPSFEPNSSAIMLPTSGSTGVPKAAILSHHGLVTQLPCLWLYHSQFPQPSRLVLLLSTGQWMTHTILMTTCPVYQVSILLTPEKITAEYVVELSEKYRPTWTFLGPSLAAAIGRLATSEQLSSFETVCLGGSHFSPESVASLKDKLSPTARLLNAYGTTETQGVIAMGTQATPLKSVGYVANILDYRLVNADGEDISQPYQNGEMYLKGKCILKGYLKNGTACQDSVTSDGWLKTGDIFYKDEDGQLFFASRSKLGFKYLNHHIYPEEIEIVIASVPGVQQCVVCGTDAGPAAAVVVQPGYKVSRENIQEAVTSTLSDYKRLRGSIAFVEALPRTHTGKVQRAKCSQLIQELLSR